MNSEQQPISVFPNSASRCPPSGVKLPPGLTHPHFIMARGTDQATFTDYGPAMYNVAPIYLRLKDLRKAFENKANSMSIQTLFNHSKVQIEELTQEAKEEISKAACGIYREGMQTSEQKRIAHIHPYNIHTLPGSNISELSMGELELLHTGVIAMTSKTHFDHDISMDLSPPPLGDPYIPLAMEDLERHAEEYASETGHKGDMALAVMVSELKLIEARKAAAKRIPSSLREEGEFLKAKGRNSYRGSWVDGEEELKKRTRRDG
ncbi:hypothetical protein RUND412_004650 [Rhizina undulata]